MKKKLVAYRLKEEVVETIRMVAAELGVSQAAVIEKWAMAGQEKVVAAPVVEKPVETIPVARKEVSLPAGVVLGSQLTDRSQAKPFTPAVQRHEARE